MKKIFTQKLVIIFGVVLLLVLTVGGVWAKNSFFKPEPVHYHAGFIVVKDNTIQDFSDLRYMKVEPCTTDENTKDLTPEEEQIEKAHLHDLIGDVVHVHRKGATWGDLFQNIKYDIDYSAVTSYVNGQPVSDIQNQEIKPYDSLVLLQGENNNPDTYLSKAIPQSRIVEAEARSENCGS